MSTGAGAAGGAGWGGHDTGDTFDRGSVYSGRGAGSSSVGTPTAARALMRSAGTSVSGAAAGGADAFSGAEASAEAADGSGFVNHGLATWHQIRAEWRRAPAGHSRPRAAPVMLDIGHVERTMRDQRRVLALPRRVPVAQMIDILTDMWEDDGLYD